MLGKNLKKIRKTLNLSIAKLAEKIDIPAPTLTSYERGERTPSAQLFLKLYTNLNINLNWFVSGQGNMFNPPSFENCEDELTQKVENILRKKGIIE